MIDHQLIPMLAQAAVRGDALAVRGAMLSLITQPLEVWPCPAELSPQELNVAAGLMELWAERTGQLPPAWIAQVPAGAEPFFLVKAAERMPHLRRLCEEEGPIILRRRNLYAPPNYLTFV